MNNILSYIQYREKVRLYESMISQTTENNMINEGLFDGIRKKIAARFVSNALKEEVEQGKKFEKVIKESIEELRKMYKDLDTKGKLKSHGKLLNKVEKMFNDINEMHFDTLSLLEDADLDFAGFMGSIAMTNAVNLSALLSPIKNIWIMRKSYQYFIGLIKQTIRKDLILLQVNFDKFQNTILKSVDDIINDNANASMYEEAMKEGEDFLENTLKSYYGHKKWEHFIRNAEKWEKIKKDYRNRKKIEKKENPYNNLWDKLYDNTYTQTAETLKSFSSDDTNKYLEGIKGVITKMASKDENITIYADILLSNAEEKAMKASSAIHNNFLKMSEVFKLSNQKKLIELIEQSEKEEKMRIEKEMNDKKIEEENEKAKEAIEEGKKIFKNKNVISFSDIKYWYDIDSEDRNKILTYLMSDDGKDDSDKLNYNIKIILPNNKILESVLESLLLIKVDKDISLNKKDFGDINDIFSITKKITKVKYMKKKLELLFKLLSDGYGLDSSYNKSLSSYFDEIYDELLKKPTDDIHISLRGDSDKKDFDKYIRDVKKIVSNNFVPIVDDKGEKKE